MKRMKRKRKPAASEFPGGRKCASGRYTLKDFKEFYDECVIQQGRLGLDDWDLVVKFSKIGPDRGRGQERGCAPMAIAESVVPALLATVTLDSKTSWENKADPRKLARHEMAHLFLAKLRYLGECRFVTDSEFDAHVESLCNLLSAALRPGREEA